jgi:hypothetical protein
MSTALCWVPMTERAPDPDTVCAVILRYSLDSVPFVAVDEWRMYRDDPTSYCWADNDENDVLYWMPLPAIPNPCDDPRFDVAQEPLSDLLAIGGQGR